MSEEYSCDDGCKRCVSGCQGTCDRAETFCRYNQYVDAFTFGQCIDAGQVFLTKANWDNFINNINNARRRGNPNLPGGQGSPWTIIDTNSIMTAEKFNEVSRAINSGQIASSGIANPHVDVDDIILGSYFQKLESYTNGNYKYSDLQCNTCNTGCNEECDSCQSCDSGCNSCDNVYEGCCGCDSCDVTCEDHVEPEPEPEDSSSDAS